MWIPNQQWRWMRTAATLVLICWIIPQVAPAQDLGTWELLLENAGIACMHAALTRFGTVVMIDRTDIGASQIGLPAGVCRDSDDLVLKHDCTAHSVVFDPVTKTVRPLFLQTDPWCSSGQFMPDGSLMQTGGDFDGVRKIRSMGYYSSNFFFNSYFRGLLQTFKAHSNVNVELRACGCSERLYRVRLLAFATGWSRPHKSCNQGVGTQPTNFSPTDAKLSSGADRRSI